MDKAKKSGSAIFRDFVLSLFYLHIRNSFDVHYNEGKGGNM